MLRKLLSIVLLAVFGLPLVSPLLARGQAAETGLAACCRRNGKHHCAMSMGERQQLFTQAPQFRAPLEKCPFCPLAVTASHSNILAAPLAQAIFASLASHPATATQAECKRRIARDRSRQKRGPPADLLG